jgi:hypothetical protein
MMSFLAVSLGDLHNGDDQRPACGQPNDRASQTESREPGIAGGGNDQKEALFRSISKNGKPSGRVLPLRV